MDKNLSGVDQIRKFGRIAGIIVILGLILLFSIKKSENYSISIKDDSLSLTSPSGETVKIADSDIITLDKIQSLDLGEFVSGTDSTRYQFGVWNNSLFGNYHLCVTSGVDNYIVIETTQGFVVMNVESADVTDQFYKAFSEMIETKQP